MRSINLKHTFSLFIVWRLFLFLVLFFAVKLILFQENFLGGGTENYMRNPYLWAWLNFDGEHLLSISLLGYKPLQYFFFPLYPTLVSLISKALNGSTVFHAVVGLIVSNISLLIGLIGMARIIELDYSGKIVRLSLLLFLVFPTSFYFGSFYSESLFLALTIWCFYFACKKKWIVAGLLAGFASSTRLIGIVLFPALLAEMFMHEGKIRARRNWRRKTFGLMLAPLGLLLYMLYLSKAAGDPLEFFHNVGIYGPQRTAGFVLLPQVFFRYVFKILPSINYYYFPVVFATWFEMVTAILFGMLGTLAVLGSLGKLREYKIRWSYTIFLVFGYIMPTLSGSFSSLPRYVAVLFPGFIISAIWLSRKSFGTKLLLFLVMIILLVISEALFLRGFWVS